MTFTVYYKYHFSRKSKRQILKIEILIKQSENHKDKYYLQEEGFQI